MNKYRCVYRKLSCKSTDFPSKRHLVCKDPSAVKWLIVVFLKNFDNLSDSDYFGDSEDSSSSDSDSDDSIQNSPLLNQDSTAAHLEDHTYSCSTSKPFTKENQHGVLVADNKNNEQHPNRFSDSCTSSSAQME